MLSDRSYMRDTYGRQTTPLLTWMLCALVAGFILQLGFDRLLSSNYFQKLLEMTQDGLAQGHVWTLVSYTLLHGNPLAILMTGLAIYFFGREVGPLIGEKRLLGVSVVAAVFGALVWLSVHYGRASAPLIGASSIAYSLLALFGCLYPNREITFLMFFVFPVKIKPKYAVLVAGLVDIAFLILSELPNPKITSPFYHSAHLGGMIAGLLYFLLVHRREWKTPDGLAEIELPRWLRKTSPAKAAISAPVYKVNIGDRQSLRAEVDRILDKINSEGFGALTSEEKRILDEAKDTISRR